VVRTLELNLSHRVPVGLRWVCCAKVAQQRRARIIAKVAMNSVTPKAVAMHDPLFNKQASVKHLSLT